MTEPAELLLIRDQYELAFHSLSRGLTAEEAGNRAESLVYYRKGRQHLTQGLEVPTGAERQQGPVWDTARLLQQRMRDTLRTVDAHLSDLETSQLTTEDQRGRLLMDLPPNLYPDLAPSSQPPQSSLHHLYPTVPTTTQSTTPTPAPSPKVPPRPQSPAVLPTHTLPAAAPQTIAMANSGDQPPAYTPRPTLGHRSLSHSFGPRIQTGETGGGDGNELLFIPSGVQIFFVAPNGQVSSLSHPGFLRIITLASHQKGSTAGRPSAFLNVCDWMYPLTRDVPVLLATSGIYMFPDTLSETPGSYVGIVLSSELPAVQRDTFQDLISQLAELRVQDPTGTGSEVINLSEKVPLGPTNGGVTGERNKPLPGWSEKMAQGIMTGATRLSVGFVKGAEATGRAIHKGSAKIRDHITPEETPSEVSPNVTKGLNATKQVTGGALRVSQFLVNGVSTVVGHVADKMAPHVKKQGAKLVPESLKNNKDGGPSNWDGAKFVAASSVQGFSTVWASLETGAKLVGKSVATETVNTMTYKYGNDAGEATDTAVKSVVNIGVTAYNIDNLGLKAILKSAGKKTAKAMAKGSGEQPPQSEEKEGNEGKEGKEAQKRELEAETHVKEKQKKEEEENEK